jgi:hypothetical protein
LGLFRTVFTVNFSCKCCCLNVKLSSSYERIGSMDVNVCRRCFVRCGSRSIPHALRM